MTNFPFSFAAELQAHTRLPPPSETPRSNAPSAERKAGSEFQERDIVRLLILYGQHVLPEENISVGEYVLSDIEESLGDFDNPLYGKIAMECHALLVEGKVFDDEDNEGPRGERGEIVIRGTNVMKGYYKRPEATAEAFRSGWFHTGDVGIMDDEGYLAIVDRKKDMILRGGYNVYPRQLEEVIITHPAVSLVAVIGVPDDRLGEEVKAYVVLNQGHELTREEFIEWCRSQIAANKYPRHVEFRDSLPIGNTGKIIKRALKEEITR